MHSPRDILLIEKNKNKKKTETLNEKLIDPIPIHFYTIYGNVLITQMNTYSRRTEVILFEIELKLSMKHITFTNIKIMLKNDTIFYLD